MTPEEKSQATIMWVLTIVIHFISPIIFMVVGKDKPGLYKSSVQALTFSICAYIAFVALGIVVFVLGMITGGLGFILYILFPLLGLFCLYVLVMGIMSSNNGVVYEPPVTGPIAKKLFNI